MKANVPTRKKIKFNWFKSKCDFNIEREIKIQYTSETATYNKQKWDAIVRYMLKKEGENKEIPLKSPITCIKIISHSYF